MPLRLVLLVGLGSALGGCLRFALHDLAMAWEPLAFSWDTLIANVSGSFLIGWFAMLVSPGGRLIAGSGRRDFVMAGILGGYTTFSMFSLETLQLLEDGQPGQAGVNIAGTLASCLLAVWLGHVLGARMNRRQHP